MKISLNMKTFCRKGYLNLRSILKLKKEDALIVSYPKVGSTWIRYFLFLLYNKRFENHQPSIDSMNFYMPEFGNKSMFNQWRFEEYTKVVKTHKPYHTFFNQTKVIYIIRDPRETMVSLYYYLKGKKDLKHYEEFSSLLRSKKYGLDAYIKHYKSWEKHIGLLVKYEVLKSNTFDIFKSIVDFLEINQSNESIKRAIEGSDFKNMQSIQNRSLELVQEFKGGYQFIRSGSSSEWKQLFSKKDLAFFEELKKKYAFYVYDF